MNLICKICSIPASLLAKVPGLGPIVRACGTTVGQKLLMALSGLALIGFLVAHLAGNLLLYAGETEFNAYAERLHSLGPVLLAAEVGLAVLFVAHITLALSTAALSRQARRKGYAVKETKQQTHILGGGGASSFMLPTGLAILVFLVLHVADMKFNLRTAMGLAEFSHGEENLFAHVKDVLTDPVVIGVYLVGLLSLGVHLSHGVTSAFQTLGINHSRWNPIIRCVGLIVAWVLALGFLSLLVWAWNAAAAVQ